MGPSSATLSLSSESQGVQTAEAILERCHHLPRRCKLRDTAPRGPARLSKWCFSSHLGCLTTAQTNATATSYSKTFRLRFFVRFSSRAANSLHYLLAALASHHQVRPSKVAERATIKPFLVMIKDPCHCREMNERNGAWRLDQAQAVRGRK